MKTNKQFIDEIYQKYDECQKEKKQRKQQEMKKFLNMAAVMVVALSTIVVLSQKKTPEVIQERQKEEQVAQIDLKTVGNFENFYNIIKEKNQENNYLETRKETLEEIETKSTDFASSTNVQVQNVDEGDGIKVDNKYIYYLSKQRLIILNAESAESSEKIAEINFEEKNFYPVEIYVEKDRLVVLGNDTSGDVTKTVSTEDKELKCYAHGPSDSKSGIIIYNISDRKNPKEIRKVMVKGIYTSSKSRMIDGKIYFVATQYIGPLQRKLEELNEDDYKPKYVDTLKGEEEQCIGFDKIYNIEEGSDSDYLMLVGIDLNSDKEADIQTFLGTGGTIYASEKNMYIATNEYEYDEDYNETDRKVKILKFELKDGKFVYKEQGEVKGQVENQFSMDEKDDNFRIATTTSEANNLYILNDKLEEIGKIEGLAQGESIYSVRYMGDKAYVVTFKQTDPFWVIDLSDVKNPKVLGEVKLPGYSTYLHPYDETHVIGFGYGDETQRELKLVMFDVSDFANPKVLFEIAVGDKYTYSELLYNHKAAIFSKEKNIIAFPITSSAGKKVNSRAVIYGIDLDNGFVLKGEVGEVIDNYEKQVRRIVYVNNNYYVLSYVDAKVANMDNLEVVKDIDI